jgi:hypothetical protein
MRADRLCCLKNLVRNESHLASAVLVCKTCGTMPLLHPLTPPCIAPAACIPIALTMCAFASLRGPLLQLPTVTTLLSSLQSLNCRATNRIARLNMCVVSCPLLQLPTVITILSSLQSLNIAGNALTGTPCCRLTCHISHCVCCPLVPPSLAAAADRHHAAEQPAEITAACLIVVRDNYVCCPLPGPPPSPRAAPANRHHAAEQSVTGYGPGIGLTLPASHLQVHKAQGGYQAVSQYVIH